MAHFQPAAAPFGAILENPTLRNLFVLVVGGTGVNLWIAGNAPVPGYGNLLGGGGAEATFKIPDEVPAHQPGPNVPISSIFGFPDTFVFSRANLPQVLAAAPSQPLTATIGGANVTGAFAPQIAIILGLLFGLTAIAALFLDCARRSFKQKLSATEMLLAWTQARYDNAVQERDEARKGEKRILEKLDRLDGRSAALQVQLLKDLAEAKEKNNDSIAVEAELRQQLTVLEKQLRQELDEAREQASTVRKQLQDAIKRSADNQAKLKPTAKANAVLKAELAMVNGIVKKDGTKIASMERDMAALESKIRGLELDKVNNSLAHSRALQKKDAEAKKAKADFLAQLAAATFKPEVTYASTQTDIAQTSSSGTQTSTGDQTSSGIQTSRTETSTSGTQTSAGDQISSGTQASSSSDQISSGTQTSSSTETSSSSTQTDSDQQKDSVAQQDDEQKNDTVEQKDPVELKDSVEQNDSVEQKQDTAEQKAAEQTDTVEQKDSTTEHKGTTIQLKTAIQVSKHRIRSFLPEEYHKRTAGVSHPAKILTILLLPCFDPQFADLPIPQPISSTTTDDSTTVVTCVECHHTYTKQDLHHHFGICRAFFEAGAVYCLTTKKCYVDNAAFRSQHKTFCSIEGCAEKVARPEKRVPAPGVPGAPTGPKGLMGSRYATPGSGSGSGSPARR